MIGEKVATFDSNGRPAGAYVGGQHAFVQRAVTDPVMAIPAITPIDYSARYPVPLDPTEIWAMCSEVSMARYIREVPTLLKTHLWREVTALRFGSGTMASYAGFADGGCPEPYESDGDNLSVDLKNIGVYKSLTISDILHARGAAPRGGIMNAVGGMQSYGGLPGTQPGSEDGLAGTVADLKEISLREGMALLLNAEDYLLVKGNKASNSLVFDGIETIVTAANGAHTNSNTASGTFSAAAFDRFLGERCASADVIAGHPSALQEVQSAYFQLGFQGSQVVNYNDGSRIVPGYNFASSVNTGVGRLDLIADSNFTRTDIAGGNFQSSIFVLKTSLDGQPLVYRPTQIPLSMTDLVPGCTAIQFEVWKKTALVIAARCTQSRYYAQFTGRLTTTCATIG